MQRILVGLAASVAMLLLGISPAFAETLAEIRWREEYVSPPGLVGLADLADIITDEPLLLARLSQVKLFPGPPRGVVRRYRSQQLLESLVLAGMDLSGVRFTGATSVRIIGQGRQIPREFTSSGKVPRSRKEESPADMKMLVKEYMRARGVEPEQWRMEIISPLPKLLSLGRKSEFRLERGPENLSEGEHRFLFQVTDAGRARDVSVIVDLQRIPGIVVATRALPRGTVITARDVKLEFVTSGNFPSDGYGDLDQVIGLETTRGISAGQHLRRGAIRRPVLVFRNKVVTVRSRTAGVQVTTSAKAREDGGLGDVIRVEALEDRNSTYLARVSGPHEVEVLAGAPVVGRAASPSKPRATGRPNNQPFFARVNRP